MTPLSETAEPLEGFRLNALPATASAVLRW
nr:MAG TPA: hypothetical protein [Caudoviricetes sp.]